MHRSFLLFLLDIYNKKNILLLRIWGAHGASTVQKDLAVSPINCVFLPDGQVELTTRDGKKLISSPKRLRDMGFNIPGQPLPPDRSTGAGVGFRSGMSQGRQSVHLSEG